MILTGKPRRTWTETLPLPFYPPQLLSGLTRARTRASALERLVTNRVSHGTAVRNWKIGVKYTKKQATRVKISTELRTVSGQA
jgi:hypothetical protein